MRSTSDSSGLIVIAPRTASTWRVSLLDASIRVALEKKGAPMVRTTC